MSPQAILALTTALVGTCLSGCDDRNPTADIDRLLGLIGAEQDRVSSMEERLNQPPAAGVLVANTVAPSSSAPPEPSSSAPPVASLSSSSSVDDSCTESLFRVFNCVSGHKEFL